MSHENYMMWMSLDLDGALGGTQRAALRQHVRTCASCAVVWERMNLIDRTLAVQPEASPRIDLTARVMARVAAHETQRRWYPWFLVLLAGILTAAVISVALPLAIVLLGLYKPLLDLPVVATLIGYASEGIAIVRVLAVIGGRDAGRGFTYLTTDPVALAVVITALSLAATWIGMRETIKTMRSSEPSRQIA